MKKVNLLFFAVIIIEIIAMAVTYSIPGDLSPGHRPSFLNPFGLQGKGTYLAIFITGAPASPFYIVADLFILTIIIYLVYLLIKKIKNK